MANPAPRMVTIVKEHGKVAHDDSPKCWAYTIQTIVNLSKTSRSTVFRHIKAGKLNMESMASVLEYVNDYPRKKSVKPAK